MDETQTPQPLDGLEVEIMRIPVISTAHVSEGTRDVFETAPESKPRWVNHCARYEYGWFIAVPTEEFEDDATLPDELKALFAWARKNDFYWLRLDSDGAQIPGLPTFDW